MDDIPTEIKLKFVEAVVLASFGDPPPHQNGQLRTDWIGNEINTQFSSLSDTQRVHLIRLSNTIHNLAEAKEKLADLKTDLNNERSFTMKQIKMQLKQQKIELKQKKVQSGNRKRKAEDRPQVSIRQLLVENQKLSLDEALSTPLEFDIPVNDPNLALNIGLQHADSEISGDVASFLNARILSSSEMGTSGFNVAWYRILYEINPSTVLYQNQSDPSSMIRLRPDVVFYYYSAMFLRGEEKSASLMEYNVAEELIDKLHADAYLVFPSGCQYILGYTSVGYRLNIYKIFHNKNGKYSLTAHESFNLDSLREKVSFLVFLFKFLRFVITIRGPNRHMHLIPGVRCQTRSGHHVLWDTEGLMKTYNNHRSIRFDLIQQVYAARLPHVEYGYVKSMEDRTTVTTRIGRMLISCISDGTITKEIAYEHIKQGVGELHNLGLAHCDIDVGNCFVDESGPEPIVFLDDLEFICPVSDPPIQDHNLRLSPGAEVPSTAGELDYEQLKNLLRNL